MTNFGTMNAAGKLDKDGFLGIVKSVSKDNAEIIGVAGKVMDACLGLAVSADK